MNRKKTHRHKHYLNAKLVYLRVFTCHGPYCKQNTQNINGKHANENKNYEMSSEITYQESI